MKRVGFILLGAAVFAIVVILALFTIFISRIGPFAAMPTFEPMGNTFSRVNTSLLAGGDSYGYTEEMPMPAAMPMSTQAAPYDSGERSLDENGNPVEQKRLVIKNADLIVVVKDPTAKMQAISTLAESMGGYVVSSSMGETYLSDGTTKVPEGSIVVRIPAPKLEDALKEIKADAVEVRNESKTGQDVTREYTDLQSQLKNLQATEKKLTEIMDKAEKTEDVLAVFNQLTQIRGQIEVIIGQMQYYEQSAAMSAVSVRIVAEKTIQPIKIAGWEPQGEARDALQALVDFFQNFVNFLIWLVIFFIPVTAILIVMVALLWRLVKWLWRKASPKKPEVAE